MVVREHLVSSCNKTYCLKLSKEVSVHCKKFPYFNSDVVPLALRVVSEQPALLTCQAALDIPPRCSGWVRVQFHPVTVKSKVRVYLRLESGGGGVRERLRFEIEFY